MAVGGIWKGDGVPNIGHQRCGSFWDKMLHAYVAPTVSASAKVGERRYLFEIGTSQSVTAVDEHHNGLLGIKKIECI